MADATRLPPLSGEIMAGPAGPRDVRPDAAVAVDVEFETLRREPGPPRGGVAPARPATGIEVLRRGIPAEPAPTARGQPGGPGFWLCGATAAALAFWVSGGHAVLRQPAVEASPIRLASLATRLEENRGRASLLVDGALENPSASGESLPDVTVNVIDADGRTTRYRLGVAGRRIGSGGVWRFSSRLDAPKAGVRSVTVTLGREG